MQMARSNYIPANKIILTTEQEQYLLENYATLINRSLCKKLGVSTRTLTRLARERGLVKDMGAIEKQRVECISESVKRYFRINGYKGNPQNGEATRFKPGFRPIELFGEEKFRTAHKMAAETRKKRFAEERARVTFGLPQKTRMRVKRQPRQKILDRSYLKRRGYIIDDRENIAYWTTETRRATRLEAKPRRYYSFKQYKP